MKTWYRAIGIGAVALGIGATIGLPQAGGAFTKGKVLSKTGMASLAQIEGRRQVNPQKIDVLRRPKVAFNPFPFKNPLNGKAISREAFIDLPAMGDQPGERARRVKAGQYFDELNKLEKGFNDLGYSLKSPEDEVVIQRSRVDKGALGRIALAAKSQHKVFDRATMFTPPTFADFGAGGRIANLAIHPGLVKREPSPIYNKSFQYQGGDPDIVTGFVRGSLKTEGSRTKVTVSGDFAIGATLFKKSADILRMTGSMNSPGTGPMTGRVELQFLGFVVHSYKKDTDAPFTYNSDFTKEFRNPIVPIAFMLGPIPMTGEVGIVGRAGVKYGINLAPLNARGFLAPYGNVGVYAEIGTGIPIVSLGVGAELILVEDRVELVGVATVMDVTTPQPYLMLTVAGTNVLEMLSGRLYFWVKIPVPTWKPPFFKKKKYDWDVFEWEGIKVQGVLFNQSKRVNL